MRVQLQFLLGKLFRATLLAAACILMFTLPSPTYPSAFMPVWVMACFALGGAAIGSLFRRTNGWLGSLSRFCLGSKPRA